MSQLPPANRRPHLSRAIVPALWVVLALLTSALTCGEVQRRTEPIDPMFQQDEVDVMVDYGATLQAAETATARASGPVKQPAGSEESEEVPDLAPAPVEEAPAPAEVVNFAGSWHSATPCDEQDAPYRWQITLNQQPGSDVVTGELKFHVCPGGGRATYNLTGTATTSDTLFLEGTKTGGRGDLNSVAPAAQTFRVTQGGEPFPNFAP